MVNMNSEQTMNHELTAATNEQLSVTREQVSRWMDGDIASHEIDLAMKTLCAEETRYCWAEMHFVGDCIRGLEPTKLGCADSIRAAIALEPTIVAPQVKTARQRSEAAQERTLFASMRQMGRGGRAWATAAAVAAVGFVGTVVYQQQSTTQQIAALPQGNGAIATQAVGFDAANGVNSAARETPRSADFNALLQAHQESADASSMYAVRQYLRPAVALQVQPSNQPQ
jgi:negative regulator of sigma E activity